jgi:hypothetical protein
VLQKQNKFSLWKSPLSPCPKKTRHLFQFEMQADQFLQHAPKSASQINSARVKCEPIFICRCSAISVGRRVMKITQELTHWRSVSSPWQCSCTCHYVQESVALHPPHSPDLVLKLFYLTLSLREWDFMIRT